MKFRRLLLAGIMFYLFFCFKGVSAEATQTITIESYRTQAQSVDADGKSETVLFSKTDIELYYYDLDGNKCLSKTIQTDDAGYIKNVSLEVPDSIHRNQLFFRYLLKNDRYGYLVNSSGSQYGAITSIFIPGKKVVNTDTTREFPNAEVITSAAKTWELYVSSLDEIFASVEYAEANTSFKMRDDFEFKPLFVQYQKDEKLGNSFNIAQKDIGLVSKGTPYISINDADVSTRLINLIHEWSHWAMYSALGKFDTGGGYYSGYYTDTDPRVSWKEGGALAQSNIVSTRYWDWAYKSYQFGRKRFDTSPQDNNVIGRSTLSTVNGVLVDIFDKDYTYKGLEGVNEEEFYDLASDHSKLTTAFNTDRAIKDGRLANGLLMIAMVNSEARLLSEYIQYLKSSGMVKNIEQFDAMLSMNGIDTNGNYTLEK